MRFRLLGPLSVVTGTGESLDIGRPKLRLLLALLLLRPNAAIPADRLVCDLWDGDPPRSARANLKTYVWTLRRRLSPTGSAECPVSTVGQGYAIRIPPDSLDLSTFERLVAEGREARRRNDPGLAVEHFERALALWRGPAFDDVPGTVDKVVAAAQRLEEQRLITVEDLIDARLATGRPADVIGELRTAIALHPLRERLWEQLMLALYRDGRQAESLATYQSLRKRLVDEAGVEPSGRLRDLQCRILAADPALTSSALTSSALVSPILASETLAAPVGGPGPAAPVRSVPRPRQLPADVATFTGRDDELGELDQLLRPDRGRCAGPIVVIHGAPGVGKSALAIRAANVASTRFPDGQLYVNLRGATPGVVPLAAVDALGRFLRALGVVAADVPHDVEEAAALFRSLLADRRLLILLDDVTTAAQLRPLLPGSPDVAVLVTSRASLAAVDGSVHLHLDPLLPGSAQAMLGRLIGVARATADPDATRRLAELCDHLPLSLHVAASRLKARPHWAVRHLVDRLADERRRLTELAAGDVAVRSSLGVSITALRDSDDTDDRVAVRAFCRLGLLRVAEFELGLAAALFDVGSSDADRTIECLVDAHLVESAEPGRYYLHDLIRLFAAELADDGVPPDEQAATLTRGLGYYLATARRATELVYPKRTHYPVPDVDAVPRTFTGSDDARRWLERERVHMIGAARQALGGRAEPARLGVGLTLALHWFLIQAGYPHDVVRLTGEAVVIAGRLGDRRSVAYAHGSAGHALVVTGRLDEALTHLTAELAICRELGERFGEQRALGNLGTIHLARNQPEKAIPYLNGQLAIAREIGAEVGESFALIYLGKAHHQLGNSEEAIRLLAGSLTRNDAVGDDYLSCVALFELGSIYIDQGQPELAVSVLVDSVDRARQLGYHLGIAWSLNSLARAWRLVGVPDRALEYAAEAVALTETFGDTRVRTAARAEYAEALAARE